MTIFKIVSAVAFLVIIGFVLHAMRDFKWLAHIRATPGRLRQQWYYTRLNLRMFLLTASIAVALLGPAIFFPMTLGMMVILPGALGLFFSLWALECLLWAIGGQTLSVFLMPPKRASGLDTVRQQKALGDARVASPDEIHAALSGGGTRAAYEFEE